MRSASNQSLFIRRRPGLSNGANLTASIVGIVLLLLIVESLLHLLAS
jgi:hypothetical protein